MKSDPGLYDFAPYRNRAPIVWPGGKQVAVWVAPNLEYYEIDPPLHPRRKAWTRPHPDVVGYGHRDYGNRVGIDRLLDAFEKVPAVVSQPRPSAAISASASANGPMRCG